MHTDDAPIIIVFHGLSGGSADRYICQLVSEVRRKLPHVRPVVFIARGCGGSELIVWNTYCIYYVVFMNVKLFIFLLILQSAQSYCAAYTEDGRQVCWYMHL